MPIIVVDMDDFLDAMFPPHEIVHTGTYQGEPYFRCSCGIVLGVGEYDVSPLYHEETS